MSSRERCSRPGLPDTHYFLSISRGQAIRTLMVRPMVLLGLVALAPLSLGFGAAGAAYLAFHDHLVRALVARQTEMETAYEDRLSATQAHLDEVSSRRLIDQNAFEGEMRELLSRQARLEQRGSIVAALAAEVARGALPHFEAKADAGALEAIQALAPAAPVEPAASSESPARAYAPTSSVTVEPEAENPSPSDQTRDNVVSLADPARAPSLTTAAANPELGSRTRLDLVERSLDRIDGSQMITLARIDRSASQTSAREAAIVAETGLDPMMLAPPKAAAGAGGPYLPADLDPKAPAFDLAAAHVARDVALAKRLKALMPFVPLRKPLIGDASVTSPFGYRIDPFLGRPALHPGVDLLHAYGAEIRATGAGRVVHAGLMGGYGTMVEIDHGNGLTTRYGHMSEVLVAEGQEVSQGAVLGRIGTSGRSTGPHLHYEVRVDGEPVDPERFLRAGEELSSSE
jgi:murein DD-endopeptidase MepM/ murein hydrolase activator NlpD